MGLSTIFNTIYAFWRYARKQGWKFVTLGENPKFFTFFSGTQYNKEDNFCPRSAVVRATDTGHHKKEKSSSAKRTFGLC